MTILLYMLLYLVFNQQAQKQLQAFHSRTKTLPGAKLTGPWNFREMERLPPELQPTKETISRKFLLVNKKYSNKPT